MRAVLVAAMVATLTIALSTSARAATITVSTLNDPAAPSGTCSLHNAILATNIRKATHGCAAGTGNDTINFSVTGTITLGSTLPQITDSKLTINGAALRGLTIDGGGNVQVMMVKSGATLNLNHLTIANGFNCGFICGTNGSVGGGISNFGTLMVTNVTFSGNGADVGGGIFNEGTLTVTNSTFASNDAGFGGSIFNEESASLKSTILASSANSGNCSGTITDAGYNISDDMTCGFAKTGSANNGDGVNLLLSPAGLANNGGPTQTIALVPESPAIDVIPLAVCTDQTGRPITTDQRGFPRPDAGEAVCDIGAYESSF